jgi:DNA-binding NtrC family response regulator
VVAERRLLVASRGLILAVDDEIQLLNLVAEYLTRLGYRVCACSNSEDALNEFRKAPGTYSAVLLDHKMPGVTGRDLVEEFRKLNPGVPLVVLSGYPRQAVMPDEDSSGRTRFLQKPFAPSELAGVLASLLEG